MIFIRLFLNFIFIVLTVIPAYNQTTEQLADNIAKAYCDSLSQNIPIFYDTEKYAQVESYWDKRILTLKKQEFEDYLKINGQLRPKDGLLKDSLIYKIAQKAVKGCDFFMAFFGKGARNIDIKPSLSEVGNRTCTCLELKTISMTTNEMFDFKQQEVMKYMQECSTQSSILFRDKLIKEYELKDNAAVQRYGNISAGYLFTNCPKFIKSVADPKTSKWADFLSWQIRKEYNKAGWNIVNATKQKINDTLANQFSSNSSFKKALPELRKSEKLLKENPTAYIFSRPKDIEEIDNRATHKFICRDDKKAIFQIIIECESDAYGKVRTVKFIPRNNIQNLKEIDEDIRTTPPPPPPPPLPPPISAPSKN